MGLKVSRKVLSILLTAVIATATVCTLVAAILSATFATQEFIEKHIVTDEVVAECDKQLIARYEVLEAESGIPARVFMMVTSDYSTKDNMELAAAYIFSDESAELYSKERVNYFYNLCKEFVEGNELEYKDADIQRLAEKAARIYSEVAGLHNTDVIREYLSLYGQDCAKASSISIFAIVLSTVLLVLLYSKRNEAVSFVAGGVEGGAIATVFGALFALIAGIGSDFDISPAVYQSSFAAMMRIYFAYLILAGMITLAVSLGVHFFIAKKNNTEQNRKATRFNKIIAKL